MTTATFDTYKFILHLRGAGFDEKQAAAVAEAFSQAQVETEWATKSDLRELRSEIKEMELRLTLKMGAMLVAAVGIIIAVLRLPH